ncbi:MAG: DUF1232 domain-containing protein [Chloroflexi bacterium]|nr:DUF1232 domain-containing protein [Chloroflexota bacterium]MCL5275955.1 DUF1232 domain-containing protein [Chloroflexota bacterium]
MSSNPNPSPTQRLNLVASVINRLRLVVRLLRDPRVPLYLKLVPFASLLYVVLPIDVVPDVIPLLGQLDDVGIVVLAVEAFIMMSPQHVVQEHLADIEASAQNAADGTVIDGEWHRVNRDR